MSTNPEEIKSFLDQKKLKYGHEAGSDKINSGFSCDNYRNPDGKNQVLFVIHCENDGESVKIVASNVYKVPLDLSAKRKAIIWQTLLQANWYSRVISFQYDDNDGEIRAVTHIHLKDATLTSAQLMFAIYALPNILDDYGPDIQRAIELGIPLLSHREYSAQFKKFIKDRTPTET